MSIRKSLGWSVSLQIWTYILFLINMVVNARLLSPEEIGVFVLALSVHMILHAIREMGVTHYLIREKNLPDHKIGATVLVSVVLASSLGLIVFSSRNWVAGLFEAPGVADVLVFVAITLWVFPFEHASSALIRRDMRFREMHHITIFAKLVSVLVTISMAWNGFSYMALAWGLLVEAIIRATLYSFVEQRPWRIRPTTEGWRLVVNFGGWTTAASLLNVISVEAEKFILGLTMGLGATGMYDRASRLPFMLRQALIMALGRVFLSAFSRDIHEGVAIGPKSAGLIGLTTGILWPIFLVLALIPEIFVLVVFGSQWGAAAELLPWLLLGQALLSILPQPEQVLVPFGKIRRYFAARAVQAIAMITCALIAAHFGLLAFAQATCVAAVITVLANWFMMRGWMDLSSMRLVDIYSRSAITSVIAALPVGLWVWLDAPIWGLVAALVLVPVFWGAGLFVTGHLLADEVKRFRGNRKLDAQAK